MSTKKWEGSPLSRRYPSGQPSTEETSPTIPTGVCLVCTARIKANGPEPRRSQMGVCEIPFLDTLGKAWLL